MPPVLPHALANGQVVDLDKVYADLLALVAYLSGNALGADFLAASIPSSRLANKYVPISSVDRITDPGLNDYVAPFGGGWWDGPPVLLASKFDGYAENLTMWRAPVNFTLKAVWCQTFTGNGMGHVQLWRQTLGAAWLPLAETILSNEVTAPLVATGNLKTGLTRSIYTGDLLAWRLDADGGSMSSAMLPIGVGFSGKAELQA